MRARFCVGIALLLAAPAMWAGTKGVKNIDIIVKKHPTGHAFAVRTDGGGTARFSLSEPGDYDIEFSARDASPKAPPERGFAVALSGEVRVRKAIQKSGAGGFATPETIALGRMTVDANTERVRLAYPRIDLANGIHTERITTFGPVDVMLRLTEEVPDPAVPGVNGLPRRLEFVAVEGGPAPARQTVPVLSDTGADWQIQFAPVDRISASFSKPGGRLAPGASDTVDVTVLAVGLAPGVYKGQISILTAAGGQTGEPAYIPLYLRILPRAQLLDPVVSRRTLVFADGVDTQSLEVTNPNAVPRNYLLEAADAPSARAVRITPTQLALQPGQSGRIAVSFAGEARGPFTLRLTPQGQPAINIFAQKVPPVRTGCIPTELFPVLASIDPRIGEDSTGTVEVWDDCGTRPRNVVVKVESSSGASFLGINDGITGIKVGASKTPPGKINAIAVVQDPLGGEITGSTGELDLGGTAMPALADADKPFEIVEVRDAVTGEPGVVAPGAQFVQSVITKSSSNIKNNFPVPVKEWKGRSVLIGDRVLDIIGETEDGDPVVEVPTDIGPQFHVTSIQSTKSGIKTQPLGVASASAAPALLLRANPDGTPGTQAPIYKVMGDTLLDYAVDGGAPPKAGDVVVLGAAGLGEVDGEGNVIQPVKVLMGGVEAKVLAAGVAPVRIGSSPGRPVGRPPGAGVGTAYLIAAEVPEIKTLEGGTSPVGIKIAVGDIESAEAISTPVEQVQTTKVKLKVFPSNSSVIYKVNGVEGTLIQDYEFEKDTEVTFEAPASHFFNGISQRFRSDFRAWGSSTDNPRKAVVSADSTMYLTYWTMYQHTVTGPGSISPASADGYYRTGSTLTFNASCPAGQALDRVDWVNNGYSGTTSPGSSSSASFPFYSYGAFDFNVVCRSSANNVNLTVTSNPAGLGVRIGTAGNFTPGPITQQVPANQAATIATQSPQILNGTGYTFTNWSTGGTAASTTVQPASNLTATANFQVSCYVLTINASGGTVTANPLGSVTGFQNNCYAPGTAVTLTAAPNSGNAFNGWAGDATGTTSPTTVTMTGPKSVTANFGAPGNVTLTVTSNPVGLNVRIGTSSAFAPGPISQQIPANQSTTIEAAGTQVLSGTGFRFANWSTGGATAATSVQPTANLTAIANFTVACHTLTVNTTGAGTVAVTPQSNIAGFPNNCYAPGTTVVLTANPNTGNTFTSWSGDASGSTSPTSITMDAPKTVTATFGQAQNVTVTLATNPAGLGVRFGASGNFTPGPISQQVPANQSTAIEAGAAQVLNGTGYRFAGWSTGATTAAASVQPTANLTATANFQVACHIVDATGTAGGTVALNPASGNVAGFPANCYAPGTQVRILATANSGFGLRDVVITAGGSPSTVTTPNTPVIVNGPVTAAATFIPRPGTVSTIFPPVLVSGNTYRDNIFFSNPTPTPGNSLQIINVTFTTTGGTGAVTLVSPLPIVFGALPANGQSSTQQIQFNIPSTVTNYDIFVTVEVKNSNGDTFTNIVSVGQTVPAAQNVTLTVASNPAGLGVRIGANGPFTAAPVSQQVPAGSTQTIAADSPQVVNGTGYRFTNWSTGAATAVTTVQPAANLTATANFQAACHLVNLTGNADGTVALNPASGGVAGFPANCFAPGSQVRLLATANTGFGLRDVVINNGGSPSTVTTPNTLITVNGPVTAQATFIPRPGTVSTIFPPTLVSGTTYRSNIFFSNPTPTPGSNLRITNVTFSTTGGSGTAALITTLPVVFGALPANGQSSTQQLQFNLPATLTAYNIFVTVEVRNANGDTFTNVVSVGHTKP